MSEDEKEIPKLMSNQIGVTCKIIEKIGKVGKLNDRVLYFTINKDNISMELYPDSPIISIDRDAIKMILEKIDQS